MKTSITDWDEVLDALPKFATDFAKQILQRCDPKKVNSYGACRFHDHGDIQGSNTNVFRCPYPFGLPGERFRDWIEFKEQSTQEEPRNEVGSANVVQDNTDNNNKSKDKAQPKKTLEAGEKC